MAFNSQPSTLNSPPPAAEIQSTYAARIAAALAAAAAQRDGAFVAVPFDVCGLKLRPLTLRDFLHLALAGNAHLGGATPPPAEAPAVDRARFWSSHHAQLLWVVWEGAKLGNTKARDAFLKNQVAPLDFALLSAGLADYLAEQFFDAPRAPALVDGAPPPVEHNDPLRVSFVAHHVHALAAAYGWRLPEILDLPLAVVFQLRRLIRADQYITAGKTPPPHFDESDRLWGEMLAALNAPPASA